MCVYFPLRPTKVSKVGYHCQQAALDISGIWQSSDLMVKQGQPRLPRGM